jgi:hypothetical protein
MSKKPSSTASEVAKTAVKVAVKIGASALATRGGADPVSAEVAGEVAGDQAVAVVGLFRDKLAGRSPTGRLLSADSSIGYAFDDVRERAAAQALSDVMPALQERVRRLEGADVGFTPADAAAALPWWWDAFKATHGAKKRELLMAALCNSFDPEVYEQGLTRVLFGLMAALDYGELWMLREKMPADGVELFHDPERGPGWLDASGAQHLQVDEDGASMESHHLRRLLEVGVVHIREALPLNQDEQLYANAIGAPLRDIRRVRRLQVSGLGERLRRLLASPETAATS